MNELKGKRKNKQELPQASVDAVVKKGNYRLKLETIEEEHPQDAKIRRMKDVVLFFIALLIVVSLSAFCIFVIFSHKFNGDDKKWATTFLGVVISSLITHLVDKSRK